MERERLCMRIGEASGRSVRMNFWKWERDEARVMPTIPHPAPSSRILRFALWRSISRIGSFGVREVARGFAVEREAK